MRRAVGTLMAILLASTLATAAGTWQEVQWSADLALDPATGQPAVYFSAALQYDPPPDQADISISWTTYAVVNGQGVPSESTTSSSAHNASAGSLYLMSPPVRVEPGQMCGAHLLVLDAANGLTYRRDFQYTTPLVVPIGLRLQGWDGSSAIDLTGVADEELEDLVTIYNHLQSYVQTAAAQSLHAFLTASLSPSAAYPAAVFLVPTAGASPRLGGASGVALSIVQEFVMYIVPSADAVAPLETQVASFSATISGTAYVGSGDLGALTAKRVFADETARAVLDAAAEEWARRTR